MNENSFYWWFWKNIDYIKITSTERAGQHGHHWCSRAVVVHLQSLFINHVCDDIHWESGWAPGGGDGGRRESPTRAPTVCIVLTEEKDRSKEGVFDILNHRDKRWILHVWASKCLFSIQRVFLKVNQGAWDHPNGRKSFNDTEELQQ